ncbi:MFS transporter [Coralloluteibacterium thermophilus]|uniref:MFS transporter n=1 Tax=Coralloluteibacterium thermophilum TaxID=2707049 RepID=A0ABV9NLU3_9GAMM
MSAVPQSVPSRDARLTEFALAVGGFGIGTGEFAIMGLLPQVAAELGVSEPVAGHAISAYALGVVVGAPLLAVIAARLPRRAVLLGLMLLFALGNVASALAAGYGQLLAFRFLAGLPHGAFFGVASLVVAGMVDPGKRAQAVGRVMLGLTVALLIGTPLATWFGQTLSWRAAFATVGGIALVTMLLVRLFVPATPGDRDASPLRELGALRRPQVWLTLATGAIGFGGMFAVFSYITPTLVEVSQVPERWVPLVLAVFGAGGVVGNTLGAALADRALKPAIAGLLAWNMCVLLVFVAAAHNPWTAALLVFLVGTGGGLVPALQVRLMDTAADAQTLAAALNHAAFNMANALGAWLGGLTVLAGHGWTSTGWVGAALAFAGLLVFLAAVALERRRVRTDACAALG